MRPKQNSLKEVLRVALPPEIKERIYSVDLVGRRWADVVGRELAERSEPEALDRGVLTVRVTDASWGKTIYRLQHRIIPSLNRALGTNLVRRINFTKRSRLAGRASATPDTKPSPEPSAPPAGLVERAAEIRDPELRDVVLQSAARYLSAKQQRRRQ